MKLYIVATPIGNLKDITFRALEVLKSVDYVLCEDTRHSLKLLNHFEIKKPLISYHQHSGLAKIEKISSLLKEGNSLALISDAGTPGISDPGNLLIEELISIFGDEIEIIPIPGVSALTTIASVAGIAMDRFVFLGFPPAKKGRKKYFEKISSYENPVVFYESKYKILKALEELVNLYPESQLIVGNELTKMFEKVYRGRPEEVLERIQKDNPRGEYVVIVKKESSM